MNNDKLLISLGELKQPFSRLCKEEHTKMGPKIRQLIEHELEKRKSDFRGTTSTKQSIS